MKYKAFLFDMNGTMIDDMHYHGDAWFSILNNDLGAGMTAEQVKSHMYGKNDELFVRIFGDSRFTKEEMDKWSMQKEIAYQEAFRPNLQLIDGLDAFLNKAKSQQILMAIGTAAIPFNVDFVLDGLHLRDFFGAIVTADDVTTSKPHPEVFTRCADLLQVDYYQCVVFEDSPKGVEAAHRAGMAAVVILSYHTREEFSHLPNVLMYVNDYTDEQLEALFN
jgi:beta-phosphoglucomutase